MSLFKRPQKAQIPQTTPPGPMRRMAQGTPKPHRVPWKVQVALICFVFAVFVSIYSVSSLWNYIETLHSQYEFTLKLGLIAIDIVLFWFIGWKLWAHYGGTRVYCFIAHVILGLAMIVHGGAVNQSEASKAENVAMVKAVSEGTAANLRESVKGKVEAASSAAIEANARGQFRTGKRLSSSVESAGTADTAKANQQVIEFAEKRQADVKTFLPEWYMRHAMWALMGVAFMLLMGGVAIGQWGAFKERDANRNGVPDWMEQMPPEWVLANYPQYYVALYGAPTQMAPFSHPAYAQTPSVGPGFAPPAGTQGQQPPKP